MYITDCTLINGNLTVNGTIYYVKSKQDLQQIESLDSTIVFEKINLANTTLVCIENDLLVNGNLIICEELDYGFTVTGCVISLSTVTI
tara:strand:+ start:2934 stop:3197 length:264 start_codon:yes stop_codon:yes gene_type:complete